MKKTIFLIILAAAAFACTPDRDETETKKCRGTIDYLRSGRLEASLFIYEGESTSNCMVEIHGAITTAYLAFFNRNTSGFTIGPEGRRLDESGTIIDLSGIMPLAYAATNSGSYSGTSTDGAIHASFSPY